MRMSTSRKMLSVVICLVFFETIILTSYFLVNTNNQVVESTERSMEEILISNARMLDMVLTDIVDRAERMCVDENMRDLIQTLHSTDVRVKMTWTESMRNIVFRFFGSMANGYDKYIRDINIVSPDFSYTDRNLFSYQYDQFVQSELYSDALESSPYYRWAPTADVRSQLTSRMRIFIKGTSEQVDTEVFRLVKRMNISVVDGTIINKMPPDIPAPYIIVSLNPEMFESIFSARGLTRNSRYMIITDDGRIVGGTGAARGTRIEVEELLSTLQDGVDSYHSENYVIDGEETVVGILPAQSSDWYYVCMIPQSDITRHVENSVRLYIILMVGTLLITLLLGVYFVGKTTRPVRELAEKAESIAAKGGVLAGDSPRETDRIMTVIESLNDQIERLSGDNVELERRERDANILMLEMQINPHFLYNTLNKLHISLLSSGEEEIAGRVIALSRALRYSVDAKEHLVYLHRDIEQLKLYLTVVQSAQENRFTVYYDIDEQLYNTIVPKMLLQPFVENSIIHGFKDTSFGCLIHIQGAMEPDGDVVYTVTDNGVGIPEERKELLLSGVGGHIGCANVHKRIRLLFGEKYGVTVHSVTVGTKISIRLPCIFER